jgi:hypothetical protein
MGRNYILNAGSIRLIALVLRGKRCPKGTLPYGRVREIMDVKEIEVLYRAGWWVRVWRPGLAGEEKTA